MRTLVWFAFFIAPSAWFPVSKFYRKFDVMKPYKLGRNAFKMHTVEEAANNYNYWKKQPLAERLKAALYLNSVAFNFDLNNPLKMDRTSFQIHTRK